MNQTRIKNAPKLTQQMIDNGFGIAIESRWTRIKRYLGATAGPVLTVAVMLAFAIGMWTLFAVWQLPPVQTAVKG